MAADTRPIGIIGLGRMGLPLARHLIRAGYGVHGYRRGDMEEFAAAGGKPVSGPDEIARNCGVILTCLPAPAALDEVLSGPKGLFGSVARSFALIELSTMPLAVKRCAAQSVVAAGGAMLDCPLSGTPAMVEKREAAIFVSGSREDYAHHRSIFDAMSARHSFVGGFGQGTKLKFIANLLVGIHSLAVAEAMALGTRSNIDPTTLIETIINSAGTSKMFELRAPVMAARDYDLAPGPMSSLSRQLEWIQEFARANGTATPLLDLSLLWFKRSIAEGWGEADQAALYETILKAGAGPN